MTLFIFLVLNVAFLGISVGFLIFLIYTLIIATNKGSPYAPTKGASMETVFEFADARPGNLLVDLGSGDGAVLIAAAERGIHARGVEINPFWVWCSRFRIRRRGLEHLATVVRGDMFTHPLSDADAVFLFLVPSAMARFSPILRRDARPGTRIITNRFPLPGWTPQKERGMILLYHA